MFAKDRVGFMPGLYVAFLQEMSVEEKRHFGKLNSQEERAKFILNHPFISEKFDNIHLIGRKDNQQSLKAREEGNLMFQSENFPASLVKYSQAVVMASPNSGELSLALANRSAALQRLKLHNAGVKDIEAALQAGYPADKQFKLYERRGQLLQELKQFSQARDCYTKASKLVHMSSLSPAKRNKFLKDMELLFTKLKGKSDIAEESLATGKTTGQRIMELEAHSGYKSLHRSVEMKVTKEQGRFTVASEDIRAGTTLLVEDPLGWALEVDKFSTHCQHCLGLVSVAVPCPGCSSIVFCSTACREEGLNLYHNRECGMMGILAASALNNFCLLTVRAITRSTVRQILDISQEQGEGSDAEEFYDGADLRTGLNLVSHEVSTEDQLMRTLVSVFLMKCLKQTEFYGKTVTSLDDDLAVNLVIHRLISSCPANTHEIHCLTTPTLTKWSPMASLHNLGAGLYPTAALFNHSCDPNIVRSSVGRKMVSLASRDIKKGEEIFDCYGLPWYSKSLKERQEITQKFYKFQCGCPPCRDNWTTSDLLALTRLAELTRVTCSCGDVVTRATDMSFICSKCQKDAFPDLDMSSVQCKVQSVCEKLYTALDWDQGMKELREVQRQLRSLCLPTLEHFNLHLAVWRSVWMLVGNKKLSRLF